MRRGVRLALDLGERRIGVARCDADGIMALPLDALDATSATWPQRVQELVEEYGAFEVVVGNPVSLRGTEEIASANVRTKVQLLLPVLTVPIRLVDERLTTATAAKALREAGHTTRSARGRIDSAAAVTLLEFALDIERRTGAAAGELPT